MKSKILRLIFLKETFILLGALVWLWMSIGLWADSHYSYKDLKPHQGVVVQMDSVITRVRNKPFFKQVEKQLRVRLSTEDKTFTLLTTEDFGYVTDEITIGDSVTLFTKPRFLGFFGMKKSSDINHLIKNSKVIINYENYRSSVSGIFYLTFPFSIILFIVYIVNLRKRLWWDFDGYKKYQEGKSDV